MRTSLHALAGEVHWTRLMISYNISIKKREKEQRQQQFCWKATAVQFLQQQGLPQQQQPGQKAASGTTQAYSNSNPQSIVIVVGTTAHRASAAIYHRISSTASVQSKAVTYYTAPNSLSDTKLLEEPTLTRSTKTALAGEICTICYDGLDLSSDLSQVKKCKHTFCNQCATVASVQCVNCSLVSHKVSYFACQCLGFVSLCV